MSYPQVVVLLLIYKWLYNTRKVVKLKIKKVMPKIQKKIKKSSGLLLSEVSRKGGLATKKKYGKKYFKELVEKRWEKQRGSL